MLVLNKFLGTSGTFARFDSLMMMLTNYHVADVWVLVGNEHHMQPAGDDHWVDCC